MPSFTSVSNLASSIGHGDYVALGGFQLNRVPIALLQEIAAARPGNLQLVSVPNPLALEVLCSAGQVAAVQCGFFGFQYEGGFAMPPALHRALGDGSLDLQEKDVYDTILELRAALDDPALRPDFTLIHTQQADHSGNLRIKDPYADVLLARAGERVVATVEEVVEDIGDPTIPAAEVSAIAVCPGGAAPTSCLGYYRRDATAVRHYLRVPENRFTAPPAARSEAQNGAAPDGDRMVVFSARQIRNGDTVVTGLASAMPMLAIELARRTHAPDLRYINCVGAVNPRIDRALPTSVDPSLLQACESTMSLPEIFDLAAIDGVDVMFFGAAQIDAGARVNLTRIGPQENPRVKLPGPAGSPSMRAAARRVVITVPRQSTRNLVAAVDVATSVPSPANTETTLITDLAVWQLHGDHGLEPVSVHRNVSATVLRESTGFSYRDTSPPTTAEPTAEELGVLRTLDPNGLRHGWSGKRPSSRAIDKQQEKLVHDR